MTTFSELMEFEVSEVISKNVKRFINQSGLTTWDLSVKTNLSSATINRIKAGQNLSIRSLCALAEALNCTPFDFFYEENVYRMVIF